MATSTKTGNRVRISADQGKNLHPWDQAVSTLVDRLNAIRADAIALRDEHLLCASEIQERIEAKEAASRAVANVVPPPPSDDVDIFSRGVFVGSPPVQRPTTMLPPVPAMKLLMEQDPPEKLIHEQSVIVRAQAIVRKNGELARERLPKQPEAQRNKTWQDYFLDEAAWMATDFREERKWKVQMARRISKMIMQYHAQRAQREVRAKVEAHLKIVKLAASTARDVRKFWSQITEIADYRNSLVEEAKLAEERQSQLQQLLDRTEAFSKVLASNLRAPPRLVQNKVDDNLVKKVVFVDSDTGVRSEGAQPYQDSRQGTRDDSRKHSRDSETAQLPSMSKHHGQDDENHVESPSNGESPDGMDIDSDDERTIIAAEATEQRDPKEVENLQGEAEMSIEELLKSQGIDPAQYMADKKQYLDNSDNESEKSDGSEAIQSGDNLDIDDESTLVAAEAEEEHNPKEIEQLEGEAEMSIEELLKSQGIDPAVYRADKKNYTEDNPSTPNSSPLSADKVGDEAPSQVGPKQIVGDVPTLEVAKPPKTAVESNPDSSPTSKSAGHEKATTVPTEVQAGNPDPDTSGPKYDLEKAVENYSRRGEPDSDEDNIRSDDVEMTEAGSENAGHEVEGRTKPTIKSPSSVHGDAQKKSDVGQEGNRLPAELLRGCLRDYQKAGMDWLISLYNQKLNGILADEMGLGKTIQTISLLAWLAVEKGIWGPHLIVVPTSVIVNWEVEFKKWLPGFKILTYFGSMKERKQKRQGWTKPNSFHVCITSYTLAVQDATALRRKKWVYLILDEAHNIKNFESQRWQTLLNFSSRRRLLLTGTPLQNSVMELWSLMHFLMPDVFSSHAEFKDWFSKPLVMADQDSTQDCKQQTETVAKLHRVLRPFLLRRLKADVEKGLPPKYEHIVKCSLSKRQRQLYEDFMARSDIQETLESGDFFGVMNVLMQLRKVCNHPDLFDGRPIVSPLAMDAIFYPVPAAVVNILSEAPEKSIHLDLLGLDLCTEEHSWPGHWHSTECERLSAVSTMREELVKIRDDDFIHQAEHADSITPVALLTSRRIASFRRATLRHQALVTSLRLKKRALLGEDLRAACKMTPSSLSQALRMSSQNADKYLPSDGEMLLRSLDDMGKASNAASDRFVCSLTRASAPTVEMRFRGDDMWHRQCSESAIALRSTSAEYRSLFRSYEVRSQVTLPDTRLVQWDCGKLQVLDQLLRKLKSEGSRILIFTQMTKVLDVLETFLNLHTHRYLRLDGTTKTDDRQKIVERFNTDKRIFCMILTTRAGGIGLNLTGANVVVFYDTDYNPAIDSQAQDRAHRIGQTKPVHIYRLVSEQTVEENILRRANEKRTLESRVISEAGFTTEAISRHNPTKLQQPANILNTSVDATNLPNGLKEVLTGGNANSHKGEVSNRNNDVEGVETANGLFTGFNNGPTSPNKVPSPTPQNGLKQSESHAAQGAQKFQDVVCSLLAAEDERERIAIHAAQMERNEELAEFDETVTPNPPSNEQGKAASPVPANYVDVETSLTPVQRYALRLVESRMDIGNDLNDPDDPIAVWDSEFTVSKMLQRRRENALNECQSSDRVIVAADFPSFDDGLPRFKEDIPITGPNGPSSGVPLLSPDVEAEEDASDLVYEVDISEDGQMGYLKALTDADADIKLYLPLRDGGPEELKISTVVNGTAAAGLECAEDAAFFPHAYNRMSRTPFATRRQKEKALANLRKRRAEKERENSKIQIESILLKEKKSADPVRSQVPKQAVAHDPSKVVKSKLEASARNSIGPPTKKARIDAGLKSRATVNNVNGGMAADISWPGPPGLFKKSTKKNTKRLLIANAKSSGTGNGTAMPGDGFGMNDAWTRDEDQKVIAAANEYNNNMFLVADVLSLDPSVRAGLRRRRGHKHCLDRLVNSLAKDIKSGPPIPRASVLDAEVFRKHRMALMSAAAAVGKSPPPWMQLPPSTTSVHQSHVKVIAEACAKEKGRIKGDVPPTLSCVAGCIVEPKHHKPGLKPTESAQQVIGKSRYPFLRSVRDDPRSLQQQAGSSYGETSSSGRSAAAASSSFYGKATSRLSRGPVQPPSSRNVASNVRNVPGGRTNTATKSSAEVGNNRQPAPRLPPGPSAASKKGVFIAGTSARMSIGQYSGGVQNLQKPVVMRNGAELKDTAKKTSAVKGVQHAVVVTSRNAGASSGARPSISSAENVGTANGSVKAGVVKVTVKNGVGQHGREVPQSGTGVANHASVRPSATVAAGANNGPKETAKLNVDINVSRDGTMGKNLSDKTAELTPTAALPNASARGKDDSARKN